MVYNLGDTWKFYEKKKHYFSLTMFAFTSWRTLSKTEFLLLKTFSHASFYVKLFGRWK